MIKLSDFVRDTLTQVIDGIAEAQEHASSKGAIINALPWRIGDAQSQGRMAYMGERLIQEVNFDVAITAEDSGSTKAGVGVIGGVFNAGVRTEAGNAGQTVSRLQFCIPVVFPKQPGT